MIETIKSPQDIRDMSLRDLRFLCGEIREKIIDTVSENGGHLASNLGMVETTVAIHKVFDTPNDVLIFDVGHQSYAHKMLTGRYASFGTLRQTGGISGFLNSDESEFDAFTEGHSGTSLSQALGVSAALRARGEERYVVAVVGDGSFTNGMIYEALNSCKTLGKGLIIILNDNEMSISKNVGGFAGYLTRVRTSRKYFNVKHRVKKFFSKVPLIGRHLISGARRVRDFVKKMFLSYNLFEALGIDYIGVANGNDLGKMVNVLLEAKTKDVCTIVHIHTKKGKGYAPAEEDPASYHSVGPFSKETGKPLCCGGKTFSSVFGETICRLAEEDEKICAVTAAMEDGTGLAEFKRRFPDRFYDVGIAEEHALTFSAGLSKGGLTPVTALYSTFAQRTFDQIFHDAAIQKIPLTLCLDRAGIVEGDGVTHQGTFDVSLFSSVPGVGIYSPDSYEDLEKLIEKSVGSSTVDIIRYPKGREAEYDRSIYERRGNISVASFGGERADAAILTYGRASAACAECARRYHGTTGRSVKLVKLERIVPLPFDEIKEALGAARYVLFAEEGIKSGGIGEKLGAALSVSGCGAKYKIHALTDFVPQGSLSDLLEKYGFTPEALCDELTEFTGEETEAERDE
ncbi:MAG: 1-deoxy-D-xylulose-5-phosphate synthase [Clostridia bacterium]|nr:1-deoxy-D-xylulose-5-phosphate synthase [Clostridia bacterium]